MDDEEMMDVGNEGIQLVGVRDTDQTDSDNDEGNKFDQEPIESGNGGHKLIETTGPYHSKKMSNFISKRDR